MASDSINRSKSVEPPAKPRVGYHSRRHASSVSENWNSTVDTPLAFEDLQRELHQRIYRFLMRLRFVVAPLPLLIGGFVIFLDHTWWRRIAIGTAFPLAVVLSVIEDLRVRRQGIPDLKRVAVVLGGVLQPVVLLATGGVLSPVILPMLLVDFIASTLLERRISRMLISFQIGAIVAAALLEYTKLMGSLLPVPFRAAADFAPALLLVWAVIASFVFVVTREMGCRIQGAFADLLRRTMQARDESLRMHQEQLSELTLLTGEIAHELKNPLASVKGLAALLSRRNAGEEPEPLSVLRREVDRMQSILEGFLNFSRPLVPLNLSAADLRTIASEVCALHEGMCDLKGVQVELDATGPVEVLCDPRKVRQVLVNLFQNALDATAERGSIVIRIRTDGAIAEITLDDEGIGLDSELADRVFEAGVTNKAGGSGLGLSVARGLARQHGGDVTLKNCAAGGCTATFTLPLRPSQLDSSLATLSAGTQTTSDTDRRVAP